MARETLYLIDGSSYIFRAYYAITRLSTSKGFPTNAIYGFVNMLMKVLEEKKPKYLVVAWDTPKPSFRKKMYAEYKSNREAPPEDLIPQFQPIHRSAEAFGVPALKAEGWEADDIIGTLAHRADKEGMAVEIISGDKDLMQLVTDRVKLYEPMSGKHYDEAAVFEKFQVRPNQIVDYLALMGDSSDNIPGVAGIGKKTAAELLTQFGSLDGIYEGLDQIKSEKRRETLKQEKDIAYLSRELTKLDCNMDLKVDWSDLTYKGPDLGKLEGFLKEFEFLALLKRFNLQAEAPKMDRAKVTILRSEGDLKAALQRLSQSKLVAVDTETTSLQPHDADLVGVSLCGETEGSYYLPLGHYVADGEKKQPAEGQMDAGKAKALLKPFLENAAVAKTGQNLKYDRQVLRRWGVELAGVISDTMLASYLIDPDESHGMDSLASKYLGHQTIKYEDVTGKGKSQVSFAEVEIGKAADYSGEDAEVTLKLDRVLTPQLESLGLKKLYEEVELPLALVLADMEYGGVAVDRKRLERMSADLETAIVQAEQSIYESAGETFNINSPKQLGKILFEKLKLPPVKKTKTGISTDESVLLKLSQDHAICQRILTFRGLGKLKSTYADGLLAQINGHTGKIHTNYNQTVAATGRLSSSNPNLQNIPVGGDSAYDIRSVFIPEKGWQFLSADYSQVELRLLADMSGDPELLRAFANDEDIHDFTARLIFGDKAKDGEFRKVAKTINFGVVYGQTPYGLSQTLKISPSEAKDFIDKYFARYGKVKEFLNGLVGSARKTGFAVTKMGRRRRVPEINSQNRMQREMAERVAINMPIQGSAADMIKVAMVRLHERLPREKLRARMVLQVHDELVFEAPPEEKSHLEKIVSEEMGSAMPLSVPLKVDMGWGANWSVCG